MKHLSFTGTTLVFLLLSSINILLGQDYNTYSLKDYYTPDIKRRSLDFELKGDFNAEKDDGHLLNIYQSSTFNSYRNTRKKISDLKITSIFSEKNSKKKDDKINYQRFKGALEAEYNERNYITPKIFLQYGIYGLTTMIPSSDTKSERVEGSLDNYKDVIYKNNYYSFSGNLEIGIGMGRIENVTDARQAIYILDVLSKNGRIKKQLTDDEILRFAQLISTVKNKRFLDARLHRIEEISKVDSFLVSGDYLTATDATYFANLYDMWLYGDLFERKSGKEFLIYSYAELYNNYDKTYRDGIMMEKSRFRSPEVSISAEYKYEKPLNLVWQHTLNSSLNFRYNNTDNGNYVVNHTSLPIEYRVGYYPNTRTHLQLKIGETLDRRVVELNTEITENQYKTKLETLSAISYLSMNAEYYISPQLLLSAVAATNVRFSKLNILERQHNDPRPDEMFSNGSHSNWYSNIEFKAIYKLF